MECTITKYGSSLNGYEGYLLCQYFVFVFFFLSVFLVSLGLQVFQSRVRPASVFASAVPWCCNILLLDWPVNRIRKDWKRAKFGAVPRNPCARLRDFATYQNQRLLAFHLCVRGWWALLCLINFLYLSNDGFLLKWPSIYLARAIQEIIFLYTLSSVLRIRTKGPFLWILQSRQLFFCFSQSARNIYEIV